MKCSVLTEGAGIPIGLACDGANRHDLKLLASTLASLTALRPAPTQQAPQELVLDRAYDCNLAREISTARGYTARILSRGEEIDLKTYSPGRRARRWVVEACHSWLNRNRALLVRWCNKAENHLALLMLARGLIALKKTRAAMLGGGIPG